MEAGHDGFDDANGDGEGDEFGEEQGPIEQPPAGLERGEDVQDEGAEDEEFQGCAVEDDGEEGTAVIKDDDFVDHGEFEVSARIVDGDAAVFGEEDDE